MISIHYMEVIYVFIYVCMFECTYMYIYIYSVYMEWMCVCVCVSSGVAAYLSVLDVTPVTSQAEWSSVVNQLPNPSISITAAPEQRSRVNRTSCRHKQSHQVSMLYIDRWIDKSIDQWMEGWVDSR